MPILTHPMSNDQLPTAEQVAAARAVSAAERSAMGLDPDAGPLVVPPMMIALIQDQPVLHGGIPREVREQCGEAIDAAVEAFGLEAVIRSVRLVAEINGRSL